MQRHVSELSFSNGPVSVSDGGVVKLSAHPNGDSITAYPFENPPHYRVIRRTRHDVICTTNGVALLGQMVGDLHCPLRVHAGLPLLAALLCAPDGLTLSDLERLEFLRADDGEWLILELEEHRMGLRAGSVLKFNTLSTAVKLRRLSEPEPKQEETYVGPDAWDQRSDPDPWR